MSFGTNLLYLRKMKNLTQEELAESMNVSRQTVSKWESDTAYPEMDKILQLCDMYGVNMDTLLRGNAEEASQTGLEEYDRQHNTFTYQIIAGVTLVMLGVISMLMLYGITNSDLCVLSLFTFLIAGIAVFIIGGFRHDMFIKDNPVMKFSYPEATVKAYRQKFPVLIVIPIAIVLVAIMMLITVFTVFPSAEASESLSAYVLSGFLLMITAAANLFIYAGMQYDKYDVNKYNEENNKSDNSPKAEKKRLSGRISSAVMLTATAAYLFMGFIWNLWHPGWVVFPIAGIICGIISAVMGTDN